MKSQFLIAFNEICREKNLPQETVLEALTNALVSAYRRDSSISTTQQVTAEIDPRTGEIAIFAEKEVAEDIIDSRTEVTIEHARIHTPEAEIGDIVMAESTPPNFGRIAAQSAKQVILQRVREAERDQLFDEFAGREGEIVNGTVQSISGGNITIGLGRTEAVLPRSQQVPGERYRAHDKIRCFILEVRRTNRGPQIFVSRSHRSLLRRLLELEVPEIYNGQVDIKSIAREAGQRSKVAVQAMQPGVDPVGACVGMRGVRIQSIVRELNDEKIDVIEWDPDGKNFIAKALSPARVAHVFLDDDPDSGRTATVIVPDDQLSLAIGREGQNARLAAKLTNWRIDIKSLTEAGQDSLNLIDNPAADPAVVADAELHTKVLLVLEKKEQGRPITAEDYNNISRLINGVEGRVITARAAEHDLKRQEQIDARAKVPAKYWDLELEELNLPLSIHTLLLNNKYVTVGDVAYAVELNPAALMELEGFGDASLEKIRTKMVDLNAELAELEPEVVEEEVDSAELEAEAEPEPVAESEPVVEEPDVDFQAAMASADPSKLAETATALKEEVAVPAAEPIAEAAPAEETKEEATAEPAVVESPLDDLSKPLVEIKTVEKPKAPEPTIKVARQTPAEIEEEKNKRKGKTLVFDENAGRVVQKRTRKKNRSRQGWDDVDSFDDDI